VDNQTTTKKVNTPKVLESGYVVKVNGEQLPGQPTSTLKEARDVVRGLQLTADVKTVEIVRRNLTETLINTFEPKPSVSLVQVDDLADGLE